jgi:hypothetical protein
VTGLTHRQPYTFSVTATNLIGTSSLSVPSAFVMPVCTLSKPTLKTAVAEIHSVTRTYLSPPSSDSDAVLGYKIYFGTLSSHESLRATNVTLRKGLTYTVTELTKDVNCCIVVRAVSVVGTSPVSNQLYATSKSYREALDRGDLEREADFSILLRWRGGVRVTSTKYAALTSNEEEQRWPSAKVGISTLSR